MSTIGSAKIRRLVIHAMLSAIILVVSFLPIRTMGLEITLSMVPVAIGAALYGPMTGALLGGVFGVVSFLQCLGYSAFGAVLLGINPLATFVVCVPTRILAGWLAGLLAKGSQVLLKATPKHWLPQTIGSVTAPILNTALFMSTLCLFFYHTEYIEAFRDTLGASNVFMFILLFVGINGLVEILAGIMLALPITRVMSKLI